MHAVTRECISQCARAASTRENDAIEGAEGANESLLFQLRVTVSGDMFSRGEDRYAVVFVKTKCRIRWQAISTRPELDEN
jgi:hypothetical protein